MYKFDQKEKILLLQQTMRGRNGLSLSFHHVLLLLLFIQNVSKQVKKKKYVPYWTVRILATLNGPKASSVINLLVGADVL